MSDDDTKINLLVLSAENDFQLKMINTNLQDIATQLNQLNGNIRNSNLATNQYLNNTNKNLKELLTSPKSNENENKFKKIFKKEGRTDEKE